MGDVLAITDTDGSIVGNYEYDAWGKVLTANTDIAKQNPLRYRGYYYDNETGYYYLQSRYYDSNICRFINADNYYYIDRDIKNGANLFEYCLNNAINCVDTTGNYSARNARSYADKWWNSFNKAKYKTNSYDCANFVSQCLYAGGLSKKTTKWFANKYKITNAWGTVNGLFTWLFDQDLVLTKYILTKKSDVEKAAKELKSMSRCTSVIIFDNNKADGKLNHAAINGKISYTSSKKDIAYYAHTSAKNGSNSSIKSYLGTKAGSKIVYILVISFTFG